MPGKQHRRATFLAASWQGGGAHTHKVLDLARGQGVSEAGRVVDADQPRAGGDSLRRVTKKGSRSGKSWSLGKARELPKRAVLWRQTSAELEAKACAESQTRGPDQEIPAAWARPGSCPCGLCCGGRPAQSWTRQPVQSNKQRVKIRKGQGRSAALPISVPTPDSESTQATASICMHPWRPAAPGINTAVHKVAAHRPRTCPSSCPHPPRSAQPP